MLTGWSPDEARNRPLAEVLHIVNAGTRAKATDPVERVLREDAVIGFTNETLLLSRDGREYQIADPASIRDRHGRTVGVVLSFAMSPRNTVRATRCARPKSCRRLGFWAAGSRMISTTSWPVFRAIWT